jgi:hypothetical protein
VGTADDHGYVIPPRYWRWLGTRRALHGLLWGVALWAGIYHLWHARVWFDNPRDESPARRRADGNAGHAQIDFGGQWVMGRMLVLGHGRELYHRQRQWEVVRDGFPPSAEPPFISEDALRPSHLREHARPGEDVQHDFVKMMGWFMGTDPPAWKTVGGAAAAPLLLDPTGSPFVSVALAKAAAEAVTPDVVEEVNKPAIGGPLYPPVHAFFYAPIGLFSRPQDAYAVFQWVAVGFCYLAGLGVSLLTRGRVPWPVASTVIFLYPGCRAGLDLAQNPTVSLTILVFGWVLAARGRDALGGMVWGLFAFKPVWAVAFLLVPLLMRRWRFCAAMVATGAALGLATLPVVGFQTWFDWLEVGKKAAALYNVNENWINLSRDLQGIPRRLLHDFTRPEPERDTAPARALAWGLWGLVFATTVGVYLWRGDRRPVGLAAAFLFLGAFLTCYRFMYYDVLLSAMGLAVLFADPARFFRTRVFGIAPTPASPAVPADTRELALPPAAPPPLGQRYLGYLNSFPLTVLALLLLVDNTLQGLNVQATVGVGYWATPTTSPDRATGLAVPKVQADTSLTYPWDTFLVLGLWAWCGWRLVRGDGKPGRPFGPEG